MIFFDTETCALHGPTVLIQWARDDGPVNLHSVWTEPASSTLALIEQFCADPDGVVGFNLAFDWFHLCQTYTVLSLLPDKDVEPQDVIEQYAELEPLGRDGPCLKPTSACDVMLHARKGPYQSTMDRGDIRIRRVPTALAWQLAAELERRVALKDIYFARRKDKLASKWQIYDVEDADGEVDPAFKDIVLKFAPSSALKALAVDALGIKQDSLLLFMDVGVDPKLNPVELGYAPFAKAIGNRHNWRGAWPEKIRHHISHWAYGTLARKYAEKDVEYTRDLYKYFGSPALGDDDSVLACMVGAVRWRGFKVDVPGLKALRERTLASKTKLVDGKVFKIPTAPEKARYYVSVVMDDVEKIGARASATSEFNISTKKVLLQEIAKWQATCSHCQGLGSTSEVVNSVTTVEILSDCPHCTKGLVEHPAAVRAREVLEARQAQYEVDLYDKFILAGRFHASFAVIGALSSRMCLPDDVWILTSEGPRQIRELVGKAFTAVVDGERYSSKGFFFTGIQEVFELETVEGHKLRATANHPLMSYSEFDHRVGNNVEKVPFELWRPLSDVRPGDVVKLHDHQGVSWDGDGDWDDGYILGCLFGDGTVGEGRKRTQESLYFFPDDICLLDFVCSLFKGEHQRYYQESRDCYTVLSPCLHELVEAYGIDGSKQVTEYLERASSSFLSGFLSAFFDTDGTVSETGFNVSLKQSDLSRVEAVQRILLRFGIHSKIYVSGQAGKGTFEDRVVNRKVAYQLYLGQQNAVRFVQRIGFRNPLKRHKSEVAVARCKQKERFTCRIKSIKSVGQMSVYDVSVPGVERFDANGFVVHNSGSGGDLNAQGIKKTKEVRSKFPLAWPGYTLSGGDFSSFEITLADACYNDKSLRKELLSGRKLHGLFGTFVFPDMSYDQILASEGTKDDKYTKAKSAVFALIYGGSGFTLKERLGVPIEIAEEAFEKFCRMYPGVKQARQRIWDSFAAMKQPGGIGSRVEWHEPADYQDTMFGFKRYFTLENMICKALFELATNPPRDWLEFKGKVKRRADRVQTAHGAVQTALFGCAFALQMSNCRAASNHEIQSAGATITKLVQRKIWDHQPTGVHEWIVQPMNVHDEIECVTKPGHEEAVKATVLAAVESVRPKVPLIKIDWSTNLSSWAEKG